METSWSRNPTNGVVPGTCSVRTGKATNTGAEWAQEELANACRGGRQNAAPHHFRITWMPPSTPGRQSWGQTDGDLLAQDRPTRSWQGAPQVTLAEVDPSWAPETH